MSSRAFTTRQAIGLLAATGRAELLGTVVISGTLLAVAIYGITLTSRTLSTEGPSAITSSLVPPLAIGLMAGIAAIGSLLGTSVAAAEIERGTAQFGWSMMGRRSWLAFRAIPAATVAAASIIPVAVAMGWLAGLRHPGMSAADDYGLAGILPILRVVLVFSCALLVGLVTGRSMAALVTSFAIGIACMGILFLAWPFGTTPSAFAADVPNGSRVIGALYQATDGRLLDLQTAEDLAPPDVDAVSMAEWMAGAYTTVNLAITPAQLQEVTIREAVLILGAIGVLAVASVAAVDRRRPT